MHALPFLRADVDDRMDRVMDGPPAASRGDEATAPAPVPLDASPWLPRLSAAAARGLSRAYASRRPLSLTLDGKPWQLHWRADAEPAPGANGWRFVIGPAYGTLWIDASAEHEWLGDAADPAVPPVLRAALLADFIEPVAAALRQLTRQRVELLPPGPADAVTAAAPTAASTATTTAAATAAATATTRPWSPDTFAALCFELRRADAPWHCHGAVLFDAPDVLGVFFAAAAPSGSAPGPAPGQAAPGEAAPPPVWQSWAALPVPLAFEIGRTRLTARELADVVPGDIVAIEHWLAQGQSLLCAARLASRPVREIVGRPSGNQIIVERIREIPLESSQAPLGAPPVTEAAGTEAGASNPAAARHFDGLAVELGFRLPSCSMPLGELGALAPGAVIELEQGINQSAIDIVANGVLIGTGHLIAVGQKLGVRVTALTPPAAQAPRERQDG